MQVLTSLEPLDYLVVAFLPGISEVRELCKLPLQFWFPYLFLHTANSGNAVWDFGLSRNSSSVVHCYHFLEWIGGVSWQSQPYLVLYTWAVVESTPLLSGTHLL